MQKKTKKLDDKIQQISLTYKQLQKTQFYIVKKGLIDSLRRLCAEGLDILNKQNINTQNIRKKKQIEDMLKKCIQIENKIQAQQMSSPSIGSGSRNYRVGIQNYKQLKSQNESQNMKVKTEMDQNVLAKKSRQVAKSIIFHEVTSQHIKISPEQLDEIAQRLQKNNEVMKQIQMMVIEQGGDIDKIQQNLTQTYQNVKAANTELQDAAQQQKRNRILKIRMGLSGFLGALGMKILGIPGLIFGFFGGMIATQ